MSRAASPSFLVVVWLLLATSGAAAQDVPASTDQHGAFAFADPSGALLLTPSGIPQPASLHTAICGGERLNVRFDRRQTAGQAAIVFRIVDRTVPMGSTCFLATDAFIGGGAMVDLSRPSADTRCSRTEYPHYQADKSRPVVGCWPIGRSTSGLEVVVIEFARRLSNALASLAVVDGDRRLYVDYPATFNGPGTDLWRVDDGGEILPERFEVVFVMRRGDSYWLALDWAGAEGNALYLTRPTRPPAWMFDPSRRIARRSSAR
jgi:hypothetical protein